MEKLNFFILDSKSSKVDKSEELLDWAIRTTAKESGLDVKIDFSRESGIESLPRDYDGYLIHLSDVSEEAINELKNDQPWSKIFGILGFVEVNYIVKKTKEIYERR